MAMQFSRADRAENPDLVRAVSEQGQIAAALRQAQQQRQAGNLSAASQFGQMAPEGAWSNLGNAMMGQNAAAPIVESAGMAGVDAAGAAAGAEAAGAAAAGTEAALAAGGAEAAAAAGAGTTAATTGATAGATGGMSGALAGLGPWGWAALAALALAGANK